MSKEDKILNELRKTERPSVPDSYFDNFYSKLEFDENNVSFIEEMPKSKKPDVPADFFTSFSEDIKENLEAPKKGKVVSLKQILFSVASIAAVVSLVFLATNLSQTETITETEYSTEEYLAFVDLDESDYIDFIVENNINYDEEIDE